MKKAILFLVVFQIIALFCYSQQKPIPYGHNPATGKYYNIRGIKMYCEVYGKGKPVLMIHGNGGSIEAFDKTIPYFAKGIRLLPLTAGPTENQPTPAIRLVSK